MTIDFLLGPAFPFSLAIVFMGMLFLTELVGLSFGSLDVDFLDVDHDGHVDHSWLAWTGLGQVPIMVVLSVVMAIFGGIGIAVQYHIGLPTIITAIIALGASLPAAGVICHFLAKIWPTDETTAISQDALIGKRATIISASGSSSGSAEAKVRDMYGQTHYVNVMPHGNTELKQGDVVLLVRREGTIFRAIDPTGGFRTV